MVFLSFLAVFSERKSEHFILLSIKFSNDFSNKKLCPISSCFLLLQNFPLVFIVNRHPRSQLLFVFVQVDMQIETKIPLQELYVYVMREFEAEKKLMAKDPNSYGVGPTRITNLDITQLAGACT